MTVDCGPENEFLIGVIFIGSHEERLLVTPETKIEGVVGGRLKTGDKIVAQITDDRKALSIKLQDQDGR